MLLAQIVHDDDFKFIWDDSGVVELLGINSSQLVSVFEALFGGLDDFLKFDVVSNVVGNNERQNRGGDFVVDCHGDFSLGRGLIIGPVNPTRKN